MNRKLLTKHCAMLLLALFATAWSTQAWADVTINVKAPSAPHMYVWNSSQTPLNGNWPGDVVTDTKVVNGETYYTKTISNENTVSVIFANDNGEQTGDFSGLTDQVFFHYDGGTLAYGKIPSKIAYDPSGNVAYFVNTKNWDKVYAYVYNGNSNNGWPGPEITQIGTDGANQSVYKFGPFTNFTPSTIIFSNGNKQTQDIDFVNGGYYVYSEFNNGTQNRTDHVATIDASRITNTATYFADANFRQAITSKLGVAEGDAFTPSEITILDISNQNISNVSGIQLFTNLEELYASNNDLTTFGYSPQQSTLRILDLSKNSGLKTTMSSYTASNYTLGSGRIYILGFSNLEELILDDCDFGGTSGGGIGIGSSSSVLPKLRVFSAKNNPNLESMATLKNGAHLEYIDLSNCGLTSSALGASNFETTGGLNLKYLDVSDNPLLYNLSLSGKTNLETLIMKNCKAYDWGTLDYCPNLKHVDLSGCTSMISSMWNHLNGTNHKKLQYLNLSNGTTAVSGHAINFPALDSLIVTNHNTITELNITGHCPSYINVTNSTPSSSQLRVVAITNCGISTMPSEIVGLISNPKLYRFDLTSNQFETVPEIACPSLTTMVMNNNLLEDIDAPSNVRYLYAQNNKFPAGEYVLETSLHGVDLGNNGFTKFKAVGNANPNLKSIALANSPSLIEIELHGNTALTQTSPDGVIESDNGLYIKGLSNLKVLNIENSSFNKLGQQYSLEGVTALETLKARHNEFTTFTNGVYALHSVTNSVNYRPADANESSLEHLVNLQYLDLAYNNLRDSVHLYRNKELRHLDVSHNAVITGVKDGTITTKAQKDAMIEKKGKRLMKYNKKYTAAGVNASDANWTTEYTNYQSKLARPFDLRECDLNDTIGLYHLDLQYNTKLEWLDFSNTAIRNTASGPTYMCPGWMDKDWVTDDSLQAVVATAAGHRWFSSWHSFIYLIPCSELKTIHADNNNMQSMGFMYFPKLDTLTISGMYGDCAYMRDYGTLAVPPRDITLEDTGYGKGNCGLSGSVRKYVSTTWGTGSDGNATATVNVNYTDPETGANYLNPVKYFDVSNSGYNEVRLNSGVNLEHANVSGNPLNFAVHNTGNSYHNSLDVTYSPNIRTVLAENCADLPVVRAHNRTKLDTLNLSNDANLKTLYVQNDPVLKANFQGLNTLTGLETLFGYNNTQWGNDITFASNTALKNLWISNIGASQLNVAANTALEKLRAYDNSLSALDLSGNANLLWLDVARNKIPEIDLSGNTALQFFNISNGTDTRTQLAGSELDNHDGSDGDVIKPTTVFSESEAPIADVAAGNSLSDLALPASVVDARANGNDLHAITGDFTSLTNIEFAHNHINGITLPSSVETVESRDNGRTIEAEFASFKANGEEYKVYFFQLEDLQNQPVQNGTYILNKTSSDIKNHTRYLGEDKFATNKVNLWGAGSNNAGILPKSTTVTPDNMSVITGQVPGTIVVLSPSSEDGNKASGTATYTYDTGAGESTFYLNWTSNGTVTGINQIDVNGDGVSVENSRGNLVVAGVDGTVVGVYDLNGRQVASETISGGSVTIEGLTPGIYVVNGQKVLLK